VGSHHVEDSRTWRHCSRESTNIGDGELTESNLIIAANCTPLGENIPFNGRAPPVLTIPLLAKCN
jgi:hypothetical protein